MRAKKPTATNSESGYCKPPKEHQFKPGQSGNPGGRPKGNSSSSIHEVLLAGLGKTATVKVNGRSRRMTQAQLISTQLLARASSADMKALHFVMRSELLGPKADPMSELNGAAEELSQRLHLIQERRRKRSLDNREKSGALTEAEDGTGESKL